MSEPKYRLNKQDQARWLALVTREACELGKPCKKFPPLTPAERQELEALTKKDQRRRNRHPAMKAYLRRHRRLLAKTHKLAEKVKRLLRQTKHAQRELYVACKKVTVNKC